MHGAIEDYQYKMSNKSTEKNLRILKHDYLLILVKEIKYFKLNHRIELQLITRGMPQIE